MRFGLGINPDELFSTNKINRQILVFVIKLLCFDQPMASNIKVFKNQKAENYH